MMPVRKTTGSLLGRLPPVRGRCTQNVPLAPITWFRVGGPAEVMFRPADADDLAAFIAAKPADVPVTVLGVGSNLLVRDGGIPGVVIRLGRGFAGIVVNDEGTLDAGAGALDVNVALSALSAEIGGLEFLSGIPGTVGGGLRMNAGAYGSEFKDVLVSARVIDSAGDIRDVMAADLHFAYRSCGVPADWIFIGAVLRGGRDDARAIGRRMDEVRNSRESTQPVRSRTGGSTFANPPDAKAWELIDRAGCRGLAIGGAKVSEQHCNFLINTGSATAADLEALGEEVRRRVLVETGVTLSREIHRAGVPADRRPREIAR